jgi:hypothetical protein
VGLILDSNVLIAGERRGHSVRQILEQFRTDHGEIEVGLSVVPFSPGLSQVSPGLIQFIWWSVRPAITTLFQYGVPIGR